MVNMLKVLAGLAASAQAVQMPKSTSFLAKTQSSQQGHEEKTSVAAHSQHRAQQGVEGKVDVVGMATDLLSVPASWPGKGVKVASGLAGVWATNKAGEAALGELDEKNAFKTCCEKMSCGKDTHYNVALILIGAILGMMLGNLLNNKIGLK